LDPCFVRRGRRDESVLEPKKAERLKVSTNGSSDSGVEVSLVEKKEAREVRDLSSFPRDARRKELASAASAASRMVFTDWRSAAEMAERSDPKGSVRNRNKDKSAKKDASRRGRR